MTKKIFNRAREGSKKFLTLDTVLQCYIADSITYVDKVERGNGFTTALLDMIPKVRLEKLSKDSLQEYNTGKYKAQSWVIVPHKAACKSKREAYHDAQALKVEDRVICKNDLKCGFFYQDSPDYGTVDFNSLDVVFFVADSFLFKVNNFKNIVLTDLTFDEIHAIDLDSSYRNPLKDLVHKAVTIARNKKNIITDGMAVVKVTATPNFSDKVDIQLIMEEIPGKQVDVYYNYDAVIERICNNYRNGIPSIIGSNLYVDLYHIIKELGDDYNEEEGIRFLTGLSYKRSVAQFIRFKEWDDNLVGTPLLTSMTSAAFEGCDLEGDDYKNAVMFFFETRWSTTNNYGLSREIQYWSRVRGNGAAAHVLYRREMHKDWRAGFKNVTRDKLEEFISDDSVSNAAKFSSAYIGKKRKYKNFKDFIIQGRDDNNALTLKINEAAFNTINDNWVNDCPRLYLCDSTYYSLDERVDIIRGFIEDRNIVYSTPNEEAKLHTKAEAVIVKFKVIESNLKHNEAFIEKYNLFGSDFKILSINTNNMDLSTPRDAAMTKKGFQNEKDFWTGYRNEFRSYQRCKNYKGDRVIPERELILQDLFDNTHKLVGIEKELVKIYKQRRIDKGDSRMKVAEGVSVFKENVRKWTIQMACGLAETEFSVYQTAGINRYYGVLVDSSINCIQYMFDYFNAKLTEIDVVSCNPRILYALADVKFPKDFYGPNKVNKLQFVSIFNTLWIDPKKFRSVKDKTNRVVYNKQRLRKLNVDEQVIKWLEDNIFFAKHGDRFFRICSYYEMLIIRKVTQAIDKASINELGIKVGNTGTMRRHDSRIIRDNKIDLSFLNELEIYIGGKLVGGWFNYDRSELYSNDISIKAPANLLTTEYKKSIDAYQYSLHLENAYYAQAI